MCVEKIEYFYPVENGNFTFSYHGNFKNNESIMKIRFNYGLYKINSQNINYRIRLQIELSNSDGFTPIYLDEKGDNGRIYNFNSGNITYANKPTNNLGNAYFYIDANNVTLNKNSDYRATLSLLDQNGNELDTARCYFDVKG